MSKSWVPIATNALFLNDERGRETQERRFDYSEAEILKITQTIGF